MLSSHVVKVAKISIFYHFPVFLVKHVKIFYLVRKFRHDRLPWRKREMGFRENNEKRKLKRCVMNNNFKKLMVAGLACMALCGTTFAAPHGGNADRTPQKPTVHKTAGKPTHNTMPRTTHHNAPQSAHHAQHRAPAPAHHAHVAHHPAPPPPPRPMPPPPPQTVVVHEETGLGALLGALVGGLLGAAL